MPLTVEDGTCVAAANAFVTRAELITYAGDFYPGTTVPDDETTDAAIMRGSQWLSAFPHWDGSQTCGRGNQGLAWPRTGVTDCNGDSIPDYEVPAEVKQATYLAALAELENPGVLSPTITPGEQVRRVKVDVIEQEFMTPAQQGMTGKTDPVTALRPVLTAVGDLLKCIAVLPDGDTTPWPWVA